MNPIKKLWIAIAVVAVLAITGLFTPVGKSVSQTLGFGAQTNFTDVKISSSLQEGTNGTQHARLNEGNCAFVATTTVAASQAQVFSCTASGVQPTDIVHLQVALASSTATSTGQWSVVGAQASSTAGFIYFSLYNAGTVTTIPASIVTAGLNYISYGSVQ